MDIFGAKEIYTATVENQKTALEYSRSRALAAHARVRLEKKVAERLKELRKIRSNIGYDMAIIYLLAEAKEKQEMSIIQDHENFVLETEHFKALERVMGAREQFISCGQSYWKWIKENT